MEFFILFLYKLNYLRKSEGYIMTAQHTKHAKHTKRKRRRRSPLRILIILILVIAVLVGLTLSTVHKNLGKYQQKVLTKASLSL